MLIQTRIKDEHPPRKGQGIRLAVYQTQAGLSGSKEAIDKSLEILKNGAKIAKNSYQAQLISFPELFLMKKIAEIPLVFSGWAECKTSLY